MSNDAKHRNEYKSYVANLLSNSRKENMLTLLEMGYTDYKKNDALLDKYEDNLESVLNSLLA